MRQRTVVTADMVRRICEMYAAEEKVEAIATAIGVDISTVIYWARRHGLRRKAGRPRKCD